MSWPRLLPDGWGRPNLPGIDFYSRLVDALLRASIEPFVTLYHWDLPQVLQDSGGWHARATAEALVEYAELASRKLGDRVKYWTTLNEPWVSPFVGYLEGRHAPGHSDLDEALAAAHHLLLAHGWAVPEIRRNSPGARVGIVLNLSNHTPASPSDADRDAARLADGRLNRWFLDPLTGRGYPKDVEEHYARPMGFVRGGDLDAVSASLDFLGVNNYTREIVRSDTIPESENARRTVYPNPNPTDMGREVYPHGLYAVLSRLHTEYDFPELYVTENGAAYPDRVGPDGSVEDPQRIAFLREYLKAVAQAVAEGVCLRGYFAWSLLDNFEWALGYSKRFGLIYVDYETGERIPKASARWFSRTAAAKAILD